MSDFIEENKKMIILAVILLALYIVFGIVNSIMNGKGKSTPEKVLHDLASIYYEELAYPFIMESDEDVAKAVLDDYKEEGLKVSLDKILDSIENANTEVFYSDKISCDGEETYVIIYPTGYGKKDYKLETNISC